MPAWLAPAIGAVAPIVGDLIGRAIDGDKPERQRIAEEIRQNAAHQNNRYDQYQFAQNAIRWRVADAKAAGLHPLAALGAQTSSFSPVAIGEPAQSGAPSDGEFVGRMGQNIGRAISSLATAEEREMMQVNLATAKANLDGQLLENQAKAVQLKNLQAVGPAMPNGLTDGNFVPGQGNSGLVRDKPLERTVSQPGRPAQEAGWRPDASFARTDTGLTPMVPESLSESLEDDLVGKLMWRMRNQLMPNLTGQGKPPASQLPKGATDWDYDFWSQEWRPVKGRGSYPWKKWSDYVTKWQD